jgi:hypothetical protein
MLVEQGAREAPGNLSNVLADDRESAGERTRVGTWRSSGWVAMKASNRNERNGPPLSVTIVTSGSRLPSASRSAMSGSGRPASR